jgi:hypothetical protein
MAEAPLLRITATCLSKSSLNLSFSRPLWDSDHASVFGIASFEANWETELASIAPGEEFTKFVSEIAELDGIKKLTSRREDVTLFFDSSVDQRLLCRTLFCLRFVFRRSFGDYVLLLAP